ncbi:phage holin family protein [Sphingomonas guangdongensis]|uniref:phage holin family protein n=1 Tax=Sphingomonas guangdongensis TaxID=1141890 RepID=UPI0015CEE876|nr:phage holin family protein [Sphingomonas guangdongensis]
MTDTPDPHDPDGIGATVAQVAEDAKAYAAAQIAVVKAEANARLGPAKAGAIFGVVAAVLALAALIALLVGLILSLATLVGPLAATGIVVVATLVIAGVLGKLAADRFAVAFGSGA